MTEQVPPGRAGLGALPHPLPCLVWGAAAPMSVMDETPVRAINTWRSHDRIHITG